jgi:hypothetical protein
MAAVRSVSPSDRLVPLLVSIRFAVLFLSCHVHFFMPTYTQEDLVGNRKLFFNPLLVTKKKILWEKCKIV